MDAHEREAAGAAAGMQELYGRHLPAIGDWINGSSCGRPWCGRLVEIVGDSMKVEIGDGLGYLVVPSSDLART